MSGGGETNTANDSASDATTITNATSGLVAAYAFNEGTGTTVADSSGSGNTGHLTNAIWTTGKYGGALSFDGQSALVDDPRRARAASDDGDDVGGVGQSVDGRERVAGCHLQGQRQLLPGRDVAGRAPVGGDRRRDRRGGIRGCGPMARNTWTHLAATYDGATLRLYVNGMLVASVARTGSLATSTNPLQIGGDSIYGQYFRGTIDEVRVYNVALTAAQIQTDMNTPIGAP